MTDWCKHLPAPNGLFYALKGIYNQQELIELESKFQIIEIIKLNVPNLIGDRHLVLLKRAV